MSIANLTSVGTISGSKGKAVTRLGLGTCFEPWIYVFALALSEIVSNLYNLAIGGWLHLLLSAWLIYRGSLLHYQDLGKYYLLFSILPMIRLISIATNPSIFSGVWFYMMTEGLVFMFAVFVARRVGLQVRDVGLSMPRHLWIIPFTILIGVVAGVVESHIVQASPLSMTLHWSNVWLPSILLLVFTGLVEELIFRGMIFMLASRLYSPLMSILISTMSWTVLHIGWHSWKDLILVFVTGFIWGWIRYYTKSVLPSALSHGLANIMLFIIVPNL